MERPLRLAPPLCGHRARGKPCLAPRSRDFAPVPAARTYARYPRYPQAICAWSDSESVTASGCGRDDPPATEVSLPSHSPGGCLAPSSDRWPAEADGRAADEAAAMRTRTGLPFSGCGGGRLRTAPIRDLNGLRARQEPAPDQRPSGLRNGTGRTPALRSQDQPGRKRCLRASALPPAQKELRFRRGRAGPGFGPGAAKPAWLQRFGA
jgi:hypothetical protein